MTTNNNAAPVMKYLSHPFVIVFSVIVIFYGGYTFGQWLYAMLNH